MSQPELFSERAIILAPNGRDGQIAARILKEAGFLAEIRADLLAVCEELDKGAGLAIIADEAIRDVDLRPLATFLRRQPPSQPGLPTFLATSLFSRGRSTLPRSSVLRGRPSAGADVNTKRGHAWNNLARERSDFRPP